MGVALVIKPVSHRWFSLFAFGAAQIVMDIEPLLGMLLGWGQLHGWTHTLIGALCLAPVAAVLTTTLYPWLARWWNGHMRIHRQQWLCMHLPLATKAVWAGALTGTFSHVLLDAFMHTDMQPLAPFSAVNPVLWWVQHDHVYTGCAIAGAIGGLVWFMQLWRQRQKNPASQP